MVFAKGYGVRELGRPEPVDEHTVFDAASLTKSFTGTLAALLVEEGKLAWDDPVRKHLPGLRFPDPYLDEHVTVRDLLAHRTGLHPANMMWVLTDVDRAEVLRRARCLPATAGFRADMVYSNVGYSIAGEALAAAGGASWEALVRQRLLAPLGLGETTASYEEAGRLANRATSHTLIDGVQRPIRRETQRHTIAAAGDVQSSAHDLARWLRLHLSGGALDGKRLVGEEVLREIQSPQAIIATTPAMRAARQVEFFAAYGLGWQVMDYRGRPLLWHTGSGNGQLAFAALLPKDGLGVVVLVNTWAAPFVHAALVNYLLDTYLGEPLRDWSTEGLAQGARHPRRRAQAARGDDAGDGRGHRPGAPARRLRRHLRRLPLRPHPRPRRRRRRAGAPDGRRPDRRPPPRRRRHLRRPLARPLLPRNPPRPRHLRTCRGGHPRRTPPAWRWTSAGTRSGRRAPRRRPKAEGRRTSPATRGSSSTGPGPAGGASGFRAG